jgi:1-acyl-sn-glycerol-3-phosphate acyltransferase
MNEEMQDQSQIRTGAEIQAWLVARVEKELELVPGRVDIRKPLSRFGLDSMVAVALSADLEDWLKRKLSPTILAEHATIEALARHLAGETASTSAAEPGQSDFPESASAGLSTHVGSDSTVWSPLQRRIRNILAFLVRVLCRLEMDKSASFPSSGPYLLVMNHLHVLDTPVLFSLLTRPAAFFVSSHMKRFPIAKWFLSRVAKTIWVSRGEGDIQAIQSALAVLRSGGIVALAPEGRISRSGGLLKGRTGAAYLASQADVPILPVVAWGQEKSLKCWMRLRRVPIFFRTGNLICLPSGKATAQQLEANTDAIMIALARLLPEEYRGVYRPQPPP